VTCRGTFDLGDSGLARLELRAEFLLRQVMGFALPPNRHCQFDPRVQQLAFLVAQLQKIGGVARAFSVSPSDIDALKAHRRWRQLRSAQRPRLDRRQRAGQAQLGFRLWWTRFRVAKITAVRLWESGIGTGRVIRSSTTL
jgi:hypothetical protein